MGFEEIRAGRLEKLKKIKEAGVNPYPAQTSRTHYVAEAIDGFDKLSSKKTKLTLVGRIMAQRGHGGSTFLDIEDGTGRIQLLFKKDAIGDNDYELFKEIIDLGDFIEVSGFLFETKQGEKTLEADDFEFLSKSLRPLPEKWHGLQDVEERYRRRYLDLLFNPELREKFKARTKIIEHTRQFLITNGFMEVETPVLQTIPGGANARPFQTHLNTLDIDLYLRIAPELYLKRLLVGGFEKVFEIARNFRNEGMDREHNPEFTMLEFYAAYWDYEKLMKFLEKMLRHIVSGTCGKTKIKNGDSEIEFKGPFKRISFNDLFKKYSGLEYDEASEEDLKIKAKELGIKIEKSMTKGNLGDEIYKKVARPYIIDPTFVVNHPIEISPLAKKLDDDQKHVARFQLVVGGTELLNGFSELNDPLDQRERFEAQEKAAKRGNEEAQRLDENFIEALEYGMPPAAGVGIGIDRLVTLLTNSHSIREIILFPLMKPRD
jgi:lysyl-tRNA synthetase, class II